MSACSSIYHNRGDVTYVVVNRTWSEFALSEVLVTAKRTYVWDLFKKKKFYIFTKFTISEIVLGESAVFCPFFQVSCHS